MSFGHGSALAPPSGMSAQSFYRKVLLEAGRPSLDDAKRVTGAVFHALRDRLTPAEADQAAAQLPRPLKLVWWRGDVEGRRPVKLHRKAFYGRVRCEAGLASEREARQATNVVFAALKGQLSPGEADDILAQLPKDLKAVWEDA
jgi:uncharacterized protein (DUF2267 family)